MNNMEQYCVDRAGSTISIVEGKYFILIHQRHVDSYGEIGANNIVNNVRETYCKLMEQLNSSLGGNHNSLLVGKVQWRIR